jgi:hypothetical protein
VSNSDIELGLTSDSSLYGSHTITFSGTMDDSVGTQESTTFTLNMIKLEGTISDFSYRIESGGSLKTVTFADVTQDPSGGNIPTYTYIKTVIGYDGSSESTADTLIFNKGTGLTIETATTDTTAAIDYTLAVKATVD